MLNNPHEIAYIGKDCVKGNICGVALCFHGLGHSEMKTLPDASDLKLGAMGVLPVFPYYGPWSWMNREARRLVDALVERLYDIFHLGADVPLILIGGSMGGHAALVYARYAARTPAAVICNCPVADPLYHSTERVDLPRTFKLAYGMYGEPIDDVFREHSPVDQAAEMPRVPYLIIHGKNDEAVNKAHHSDVLVKRMRENGHNIEYLEVDGMGHCHITNYDVYRRPFSFVQENLPPLL
jgi:pimeloyl-ACP methyl ester carboxylesterase